MLSGVMLSVTMLSVTMPSVVMLSVIMLSVVMLSVIILSVIMLNVVMLSVIMLSALAPIYKFLSDQAEFGLTIVEGLHKEGHIKPLMSRVGVTKGQCYKTFYGRKLRLFVIS